MNVPMFSTSIGVLFTAADPDYQEQYQQLLEKEDFFPHQEENCIDLSEAGDPSWDDSDDEMLPEIQEAYKISVRDQSISESNKAKFQPISFIKQFG